MRLGIITDIHNNLIALKAVVEYFAQQNCDKIICCGDLIGIGPYPEETVQYMRKLPNLIAVKGNHDKYLTDGLPEEYPNEEQMDYGEMQHHKWEHARLSEESVAFLQELPERAELVIEGHKLAIMHYCMDNEGKYVTYVPNPSDGDLKRMMAHVDSDIVFVGHDHNRTIRKTDGKWYINFGSLGCPGKDGNLARAGILILENGKIEVEPVELVYDAECVVAEINRLNYPEAENIKKFFYGISRHEKVGNCNCICAAIRRGE